MITKEQCWNGLLRYIDCEVMNSLPTSGKWILGSYITLASFQYNKMFDDLLNGQLVQSAGIVTSSGMIDEVAALNALKQSAEKYGDMVLTVPILGSLTFSARDIDKLQTYMK